MAILNLYSKTLNITNTYYISLVWLFLKCAITFWKSKHQKDFSWGFVALKISNQITWVWASQREEAEQRSSFLLNELLDDVRGSWCQTSRSCCMVGLILWRSLGEILFHCCTCGVWIGRQNSMSVAGCTCIGAGWKEKGRKSHSTLKTISVKGIYGTLLSVKSFTSFSPQERCSSLFPRPFAPSCIRRQRFLCSAGSIPITCLVPTENDQRRLLQWLGSKGFGNELQAIG